MQYFDDNRIYSSHPHFLFLHFPCLQTPKLVHSRLAWRGEFTARPKQKKLRRNNGRTHHHNVVISTHPFSSVITAATKNTIPTFANACFRIRANKIHSQLHAKMSAANSPASQGSEGSTHHHSWLQYSCPAMSIVTHKKKRIVPHPNLAMLIHKRLQLLHSFIRFFHKMNTCL